MKIIKKDRHYRKGKATLKNGNEVMASRKLVFNEYEYYLNGKDITESVIAFRADEYIDENLLGRDEQTKQ